MTPDLSPSFPTRIKYRCMFPSCKNVYKQRAVDGHVNKKFHTFPRNVETRMIWLEICNITGDKRSCTGLRVCRDHFEASDYISPHRIKDTAIPKEPSSISNIKYSCKFPSCTNVYVEGRVNRSFHKIPQEPEARKLWFDILNIPKVMQICSNLRVCDAHFDDSDYVAVNRLHYSAIPKDLLTGKISHSLSTLHLSSQENDELSCTSTKNIDRNDKIKDLQVETSNNAHENVSKIPKPSREDILLDHNYHNMNNIIFGANHDHAYHRGFRDYRSRSHNRMLGFRETVKIDKSEIAVVSYRIIRNVTSNIVKLKPRIKR